MIDDDANKRIKIMKRHAIVICAAAAVLAAFAVSTRLRGQTPPAGAATPAAAPDFVKDIQPIFAKSCYACHGEKTQQAGMRLDSRESVMAKEIKPGSAAESELYQRVAGLGGHARMPMGGNSSPSK